MFKKNKPLAAVFELTLLCNMKCMHCGSSAGLKRVDELTTLEWKNTVSNLSEMGCKSIVLMGGEPFLRKDWYEIAEYVKNEGIKLSFISNGYCIDDKIISNLQHLSPHSVGISIDGGTPETHDSIRGISGAYLKAANSVESLLNAEINTSIVTTVHKINFQELPLIRDFLINRNLAWQIQMADPIGRFPMDLHLTKKEFYSVALFIEDTRHKYSIKEMPITGAHCIGYHSKVLKNIQTYSLWRGCQAGISALGIQSNGGVVGCLSLPDEFVQGNIRKNTVEEIWNSPDFASYNRHFNKEQLNGTCKNCKYGKSCKGGCMAVSTSITGLMHADPFCLYKIENNAISH